MWLHLGGSYWQRASVDAVIVIAGLLALVAFARSLERFESRHFRAFVVLVLALVGFGIVLCLAGEHLADKVGSKLVDLESASSP
jgi:phosphate/sulfate permease